MADPVTQDPTPEAKASPSAEDLLRELTEARQSLAAEQQASQQLRETFTQVLKTARATAPAPTPREPEEPLPTQEDFEEDYPSATARLAAAMLKRGLTQYHESQSGEIGELRDAVLDMEWEKVRGEDPKNFRRLERLMKDWFDENPHAKRPGAVKKVFYSMRGQYMKELNDMDRQDALKEPTPTPNAPTGKESKKETFDKLNGEEIAVAKGMGVSPSVYFKQRYGRDAKFEDGYARSLGFREEK